MRKIILIYFLFFGLFNVSAQHNSSLLERMNEVKMNTDVYYWGQYTHPDADTAKVNAVRRLLIDVNLKRKENECVTVEQLMPRAKHISIDRGNLKQHFAYIRITDAFNYFPADGSQGSNTDLAKSTQAVAQSQAFVPEAFVQRVVNTKHFMDVYKLLKSMKEQGDILQFGKLRDVQDYSSFDLILFDIQSQEIVTMLSRANASGKRFNMVNGAEDSLDNYPQNLTAVIWYIK